MKIITKINEIQKYSQKMKSAGKMVGVVPTMGFLHEGHLSLIDIARKNSDIVIVTIFVNPTQFAPNEDLDKYPRDFYSDKKLCELHGADVIFAPTPEEMYPEEQTVWVIEEKLCKGLCGRTRPTHFRGVTSVVTKLFNATLPDIAVFGQKDAQQAVIIKKMVRDLNFPIKIILGPIVREKDGLAMSSRNKYLTTEEHESALSISRSLHEAKIAITDNKRQNSQDIIGRIKMRISQAGGKVDYVEIVDSENLEPKETAEGRILIAVAAHFGKARLLDNIVIEK